MRGLGCEGWGAHRLVRELTCLEFAQVRGVGSLG